MTTTDNVTITLEQMTSFRSGAKLLDNGYYELSYGEGKLYINSNADLSNFSFYCYNAGSQQYGDGTGGRDKVWNMMSGDNPPPFDVAFVAKDSQANIAPQQLVSDLNNKFGANITNVLF